MSKRLILPGAPHVILRRSDRSVGIRRTRDVAFTYRMGAGLAGDVNRGHPASIQACLPDPTTPPTAYGQAVVTVAASNGVRPLTSTDTAVTTIWGITVRPYPLNAATTSNFFGAAPFGSVTPPVQQPIDVIRAGYIMVSVVGSPVKGGAVFVWIAASTGAHVQGGFETVSGGGSNTIQLDERYAYNSPPDASGIAELSITL